MVVADWLGWWWWVHGVMTNKRVRSFFFPPFGRFISSYSASSFHRSIRVFCALDLAWEHREEKERCAFVYYRLKRGETNNDLHTHNSYIYIHTYVYSLRHSKSCASSRFFFQSIEHEYRQIYIFLSRKKKMSTVVAHQVISVTKSLYFLVSLINHLVYWFTFRVCRIGK